MTLRSKGTPEQVAAFPKPLFLYQFVRAWNKGQADPNFVEEQVEEMQRFDAAEGDASSLPVPIPIPTATTPVTSQPPLPSAPKPKRPTPPPQSSQPAHVVQQRAPSPPPSVPTRRHDRPPTDRSAQPTHPGGDDSRACDVVVVRHRAPKKSKGQDNPSPPLTQRKCAVSDANIQTLEVFTKACMRCQKGKRDCEVDELGAACLGCRARKYKCDHMGKTDLKTMMVSRPVTDSESEVEVVEGKGKKRRAESPVAPKKTKEKKVRVKVEKVEKVEKKPSGSKAKTKTKQRPAPKSLAVVNTDEDNDAMDVDGEPSDEEPTVKRARLTKGEYSLIYKNLYLTFSDFMADHDKRLAVLEERVKGFDKVADEATRTSQRMDAMEGQVHRFSGALEAFLGRIHIDDRLRLIPESRQIGDDSPLAITRSASPSTPLLLPMDEVDADVGTASSVPDTRTTPSDFGLDIRMGDDRPILAESGTSVPNECAAIPAPAAAAPAAAGAAAAVHPASVPPPVPAPTVNVIPATPQGSQDTAIPTPTPALPASSPAEETVPPPRNPRSRSRTPATLLRVDGPTTQTRSRSKTPK